MSVEEGLIGLSDDGRGTIWGLFSGLGWLAVARMAAGSTT